MLMTTMRRYYKFKGFTIVELIVVIAVIGILAGIGGISYRAYSNNAQVNAVAATADVYAETLRKYKTQYRTYPTAADVPADRWICLGKVADYPASSPFATGECDEEYDTLVSSDFNGKMAQLTSSAPGIDSSLVSEYETGKFARGLRYLPAEAKLKFILKGDQTCPRGSKSLSIGSKMTECTVLLDE